MDSAVDSAARSSLAGYGLGDRGEAGRLAVADLFQRRREGPAGAQPGTEGGPDRDLGRRGRGADARLFCLAHRHAMRINPLSMSTRNISVHCTPRIASISARKMGWR